MTKRNYTIGFVAVIAAVIVLNGFLTVFLINLKDPVSLGKTVMSRTLYSEAEEILSAGDSSGYPELIRTLEGQVSRLKTYRNIYDSTKGGRYVTPALENRYTQEEIAEYLGQYSDTGSELTARIGMLEYCVSRLKKATEYPDYVKKVTAEAEALAGTKLFDDAAKRRILRTGNRFYGFENIRVSAEPELGVKLLLEVSPWNWLAVFMACVCAVLYYLRCQAQTGGGVRQQGKVGAYALAVGLGCALLCIAGACASDRTMQLGDLHRAVQSLDDYYSCPYMISVGALLAFSIGGKTIACVSLYLFLVGLLFCGKKRNVALIVVLVLLAAFLSLYTGVGLRFDTAFHAERLLRNYTSISLFGEEVSAGWTFIGLLFVSLVAAYLFAGRQVAAELLRKKERQENLYFEEIDHKYTEARYIRHDINNHLTALALLMDEGRTEEARSYLDKIFEQLDEVRLPVKTGSPVLDSILFGKVTAAKEKGIGITLEFDTDFAGSGISDYDLCSVFSNLLDNAVEACGKLPAEEVREEAISGESVPGGGSPGEAAFGESVQGGDPRQEAASGKKPSGREILLRVKRQGQMICVFCENEYRELAKEGRELVTLKGDRKAHGLGLKRIRSIAEKYHGSVEIDTENGIFSIAVLFMTN